jgi:hypothetical protein
MEESHSSRLNHVFRLLTSRHGSGCGRQAMHGTSNYTNSREHSAQICSHCPTTMSNLQVCVIRLRNYVLRAAASGFCTSACPGILDNILTPEARRTPFMDGCFVSFHMTRGFPIGDEEHRTVVHRRRMNRAGRCWVQSGINYATEYVHMLNANLVSCMLPLHSRPSIH